MMKRTKVIGYPSDTIDLKEIHAHFRAIFVKPLPPKNEEEKKKHKP